MSLVIAKLLRLLNWRKRQIEQEIFEDARALALLRLEQLRHDFGYLAPLKTSC